MLIQIIIKRKALEMQSSTYYKQSWTSQKSRWWNKTRTTSKLL